MSVIERSIVGFDQDDEAHWVAELDCGHTRHVRHQPPFVLRPWTQSKEGREGFVGQPLRCLRCEASEWPGQIVHYKSTPVFDEHTVPKGLLTAHSTKRGVWGRIVVHLGTLAYHVEGAASPLHLVPGCDGIVVPEQRHHVALSGPVRFQVDFHKRTKHIKEE